MWLMYFIRLPFLVLIRFYQKIFSPDHGIFSHLFPYGFCRFYPSCSEYAYRAFKEQGIIKGSLLTIWRILKCHPWNRGGWDPVPKK